MKQTHAENCTSPRIRAAQGRGPLCIGRIWCEVLRCDPWLGGAR
jgi:hypothetical protein